MNPDDDNGKYGKAVFRQEMLMSADKVGGWGQKCQKHADVILEWSLTGKMKIIDFQNSDF